MNKEEEYEAVVATAKLIGVDPAIINNPELFNEPDFYNGIKKFVGMTLPEIEETVEAELKEKFSDFLSFTDDYQSEPLDIDAMSDEEIDALLDAEEDDESETTGLDEANEGEAPNPSAGEDRNQESI